MSSRGNASASLATLLVTLLLGACAAMPARLGEPVLLLPGETQQVGTEGFEITLRSVADDSGCFSPTDCSTMIFNGSLAVRLAEKSRLMQIQAVIRPGQPLRLDLDGYEFDLTDIRRDARNRFQATITVRGRHKGA
jgi:hypothetical protein